MTAIKQEMMTRCELCDSKAGDNNASFIRKYAVWVGT